MAPITLTRFGQTVRKIIVIISALQQIGSQAIRQLQQQQKQQLEEEKQKPAKFKRECEIGRRKLAER